MGIDTDRVSFAICVNLVANVLLSAFGVASHRQGFFTALDDDFLNAGSLETVVLATMSGVPSDLACSQRCFAMEECAYKSYNPAKKSCQLYKSIAAENVNQGAKISKKVVATNACDTSNCGERCFCNPLLGTDEYSCHCPVQGLSKTSPEYVHQNCKEALAANGNTNGSYLVQPSFKRGAISVVCERGSDNQSYAVFAHNKQGEVTVARQRDNCGGNVFHFQYFTAFESIFMVMNVSSHCQQKTLAICKNVWFRLRDCTWLLGRSNNKLAFWGGGPQDGKGCACSITGACSSPNNLCNCDLENDNWQTDEGYVTVRDVLPLTGIQIGDVAQVNEAVKFTIGPLKCLF